MKPTSVLVVGGLLLACLLPLAGCGDSAPRVTKPENPAPLPDPSDRITSDNGQRGGTSKSVTLEPGD